MMNPKPPVLPPKNPVLLTVWVNTDEKLAWCLGRKIRIRTTAAAPNTCHHTLTLLMIARRWLEKMLTSDAKKRIVSGVKGHGKRLTNQANRHRLHRDAEGSRESRDKKEDASKCRRGPS